MNHCKGKLFNYVFGTKTMKINKVSTDVYEVSKEGRMNVPVRIFASEKLMGKIRQDRSIEQGMNVAKLPSIEKASLMMSDAHQGYGFPIGGVAAFDLENGIVSPGGIGFDINCGVRVLSTNLTKKDIEPKIKDILNILFSRVPCGVGSESKLRLSDTDFDKVLKDGLKWALEKGYATKEDLEHCEENGCLAGAMPDKVSPRARKRGRRQLGTLGAGNHFVEIQIIDKIFDKDTAKKFGVFDIGQIVIMIHSGSRGLGHQVCSDYIRRIEEDHPDIVEKLPEKELIYAPINSPAGKDYLGAMRAAANYGWCNRQLMTYWVREGIKKVFGPDVKLNLIYDVCHNIAKVEEYEIDNKKRKVIVHRKGATRAFGPKHRELPKVYQETGQPILIPGSMGTASYMLVGTDKAMNETFASTPHGAGRMMSRKQASKTWRAEKLKSDLEKRNIYIKAKSYRGIVEEAPGAYKDIDEVVKVADTVGIGKLVARMIPLGVLKG